MFNFLQEMWVRFLCWMLGMELRIEVTPVKKEDRKKAKDLEKLLTVLGCENEMKFDEAMRYYLCHGEVDPKCEWLKRK